MKKITRIEDVYCVPKTEEDLNYFGCSKGVHIKWSEPSFKGHSGLSYHYKEVLGVDMGSRTEIPVDQFLDLLNDKIADWRLLEVGFKSVDGKFPYYSLRNNSIELSWSKIGVAIEIGNEATWLKITTFTELLRQMKFLGWKNYEQ